MRTIRLLIISSPLLIFSLSGFGQHLTRVSSLDTLVFETSGLTFLDHRLITHNDSGGEPALYEIDTSSGSVMRKVILENAVNTDWEDICCDSTYIYIGDFGNNYGNRKNLRIYRILISDFLSTKNDSVDNEVINFSYADQKDFRADPFFTNYDTEAMISYKDSLYIFTKNWGDLRTKVYPCSKSPGTFELTSTDNLNPKGLVTGATYNQTDNAILLSGYAFFFPFLMEIKNFSSSNFSEGDNRRFLLHLEGSSQIEGITRVNKDQYFISSEANKKGASALYSFSSSDLSDMKIREIQVGKTLVIRLITLIKDSKLFGLFWRLFVAPGF